MKKIIIYIATIFILFASCKPREIIVERKSHTHTTDTVFITETKTEKDTLFKIEADRATMQALIECDSLNRATIKYLNNRPGERVRIETLLITDTLTITAEVDSAAIYHAWTERQITTTKKTDTTHTNQTHTVEKSRPLKDYMIIAGLIIFLIIIGQIRNLFK